MSSLLANLFFPFFHHYYTSNFSSRVFRSCCHFSPDKGLIKIVHNFCKNGFHAYFHLSLSACSFMLLNFWILLCFLSSIELYRLACGCSLQLEIDRRLDFYLDSFVPFSHALGEETWYFFQVLHSLTQFFFKVLLFFPLAENSVFHFHK